MDDDNLTAPESVPPCGREAMLHRAELKYRINGSNGAALPEHSVVRFGKHPLVIVAPHAVAQVRGGRRKKPDLWTGSITESIGHRLDATSVSTLFPRQESDGASTEDWFYQTVFRIVSVVAPKVLIEVHGMASAEVDICIGTAWNSEAYGDSLLRLLNQRDINASLNLPFTGNSGMGADIGRRMNLPCLHIELSQKFRSDYARDSDLQRIVGALAEAFDIRLPIEK